MLNMLNLSKIALLVGEKMFMSISGGLDSFKVMFILEIVIMSNMETEFFP